MLKKLYLLLFNLASCMGWGYVLYLGVKSLSDKDTPEQFWEIAGETVTIVQSLAALEILHSLIRLVPSPIASVIPQVGSRLLLVYGYSRNFSKAQHHWTLYLMVLSWACVEVPRYLFYAVNLVTKKVPFPLFWLRYNLFSILYPTGISGELGQIIVSLPVLLEENLVAFWYVSVMVLVLYIPGSPFMYGHMQKQRFKAGRKRNARPRPIVGIQYPVDKKGKRGSTPVNKGTWVASLKNVDKKESERVEKERNWRFGYNKHVVNNVRISARSKPICLQVAKDGLDHLYNTFEFVRDGKTTTLGEALEKYNGTFETGFIKGNLEKPKEFDYEIPYKDKKLKGEEIIKQLNKWCDYGTIEPDCRDAIANVVRNKGWLDLSDKHFVLLGAGSAMGPLLVLLSLGAHVIAIDLDRPGIWKRLIGLVRNSCGKITFPLKKKQSELKDDDDLYANAGCNLFTDTPEICNWVSTVCPGKQLTIGGYAYLDGALFLKVSIAMDSIMAKVCEKRKDTALAFLCSPTDCFFIPDDAREEMLKNYKRVPMWQSLMSALTGKLKKNALKKADSKDGKSYSICDGLVTAQGPNYALAKRLQHWRCMILRSNGHIISTNIAPSTATKSVVHNKSFAAAYGGMHHFKPMEVMYQETSNAVMSALLLNDLNNEKSFANPKTKLDTPLELFAKTSFHGGIWRMAYKMDSIGLFSGLAYYLNLYSLYLVGSFSATVGFASYVYMNGAPHTWFQ